MVQEIHLNGQNGQNGHKTYLEAGAQLRQLLARDQILTAPGVYDGITARGTLGRIYPSESLCHNMAKLINSYLSMTTLAAIKTGFEALCGHELLPNEPMYKKLITSVLSNLQI